MVNAKVTERGILAALEIAAPDQWQSFKLEDFRNLVVERIPGEQPSSSQIVDALIALNGNENLTVRKLNYPNHGENSYNSISAALNVHYTTDFFYVGDFQLRITHKGRRLLSEYQPVPKQPRDSEGKRDELLPIFRKSSFDSDADRAVAEATKLGEPLSLIMMDIDHFKSVNDTHGHQVGDEVLVGIASVIARRMTRKGTVYRYGGEEVIVILPNFDAAEAAAVAEQIRKEIEKTELSSRKLRVTASFGIASLPEHASERSKLVELADSAMYSAKNLGRNLVRISGEQNPPASRNDRAERKQPAGDLTLEELDDIRRTHFSGRLVACPKDGAVLRITESHRHGYRTPHLLIQCPLCGLGVSLEGIPAKG